MKTLLLATTVFSTALSFGQNGTLDYVENVGQWPDQVNYKANLYNGNVYLEDNCFTFVFHSKEDLDHHHDHTIEGHHHEEGLIICGERMFLQEFDRSVLGLGVVVHLHRAADDTRLRQLFHRGARIMFHRLRPVALQERPPGLRVLRLRACNRTPSTGCLQNWVARFPATSPAVQKSCELHR